MSFFTFNDYNSSDDLIITKPVIRPSWYQEMNEFPTGSTTKIIQFSRNFSNSPLVIPAVIKYTSTATVRAIYSHLRGFGKLILSGSPDEFFYAVATVTDPVAVAMTTAEINVSFTLLPFAYAVNPTIADFSTEYTSVMNNGTVFSAPEIRFTPTAAGNVFLNVNGSPFTVKITENLVNTEIIVDCDAEVTYYENGNEKISIDNQTFGNYPLLATGETFVQYTGSVANARINVRERYY